MSERYEHPLRMCVWELTLRCNARCRLCGSSADTARPGELSTGECVDLAKEMVDLGLRTVTLSGGEPLLRHGFDEIATFCVKSGVRTDIVSNGLLIDDDMAARLKDLGLYGVTLSFDGPEQVHDDLRGVPGNYQKLLQAIEHLQKHDVRVGAITHVNRTNLPHMNELAERLTTAGVLAWRLQLTIPPDPRYQNEMLLPRQLPEVIELIKRVQQQGKMKCYGSHSIGYYGRDELAVRRGPDSGPRVWKGCPAGLSGIGVLSDGRINGCLSLLTHGERFIEGSIRERSLTDMWRDPNLFVYNRQFDATKSSGACRACRFLTTCRHGCVNVLVAADEHMTHNPLCMHALESTGHVTTPTAQPERPSIVLFVADGLRPDFLGCYGGPDTPTIDHLAQHGVCVKHARSAAAWTVPAVASMLTGMSPHRLGLVKWRQNWSRANDDLFSLLAEQDYAVGSFAFDRRHLFTNVPQAQVTGLSWDLTGVEDWLTAHHSRPSFTYVHWWGTHAPYISSAMPLAKWRKSMQLLTDTLDRHREFAAKLRVMYRMAIRHLDQEVLPRILQAIEKGRGLDNTIFIFTSDHGECWAERYATQEPVRDVFDFHGRALYEENLRVPLLFYGAVEPEELAVPAVHMDLAPTIAALTRSGASASMFPDGINLFDYHIVNRPLFAVADRDFVDAGQVPTDPNEVYALFACLDGDQKVIRDLRDNHWEWYDLTRDPRESNNLAASEKLPPANIREAMNDEWTNVAPVEWNREEDQDIRRRLRALGYL